MLATGTELVMILIYAKLADLIFEYDPASATPYILHNENDTYGEAYETAGELLESLREYARPDLYGEAPTEADLMEWGVKPHVIYFDGGCRDVNGAPESLCGYAFHDETDGFTDAEHFYGKSNNEMEYAGLHRALIYAVKKGYRNVEFRGDSKLVVEQVNGRWQVKADHLKAICASIRADLAECFDNASVVWVPREQNIADAAYNICLDAVA